MIRFAGPIMQQRATRRTDAHAPMRHARSHPPTPTLTRSYSVMATRPMPTRPYVHAAQRHRHRATRRTPTSAAQRRHDGHTRPRPRAHPSPRSVTATRHARPSTNAHTRPRTRPPARTHARTHARHRATRGTPAPHIGPHPAPYVAPHARRARSGATTTTTIWSTGGCVFCHCFPLTEMHHQSDWHHVTE